MSIAENIKFIKGVSAADVAKLGKTSKENYNSLKDDTNNFKDTSIIEAVPEVAKTLDLWVQNAKKKGIKPGASSAKAKPVKASKAKKEKPAKASKPKKEKPMKAPKAAKPKKEKAVNPKKQEILANLKEKAKMLREQINKNAKFKNKVAEELEAFLLKSPTTLGASPIDIEIAKEKRKIQFYEKILKSDVADFKGIAQKSGLEYKRKLPKKTDFSTKFPKAKAKPMYNDGTPLSGLGKKKVGKPKTLKKSDKAPTKKQVEAQKKIKRVSLLADGIQERAGYKVIPAKKVHKMNRSEAVKKAWKSIK